MEVKKKIGVWCALFALLVVLFPLNSVLAYTDNDVYSYNANTMTLYTALGEYIPIYARGSTDTQTVNAINNSDYKYFVAVQPYEDKIKVEYWFFPKEWQCKMIYNANGIVMEKSPNRPKYVALFKGGNGKEWTQSEVLEVYEDVFCYVHYVSNYVGEFGKYGRSGYRNGNYANYLTNEWGGTPLLEYDVLDGEQTIFYSGNFDLQIEDITPKEVSDVGEALVPILRFITNFFEYSFVAFGYEISIGAIVIFSIMGGMLISFMRR